MVVEKSLDKKVKKKKNNNNSKIIGELKTRKQTGNNSILRVRKQENNTMGKKYA